MTAKAMLPASTPAACQMTPSISTRREDKITLQTQALEDDLLTAASWELVEKPTIQGSTRVITSLSTWALLVAYFCSFGTELSIIVCGTLGSHLESMPFFRPTEVPSH